MDGQTDGLLMQTLHAETALSPAPLMNTQLAFQSGRVPQGQ